jgi:TonB family protein
MISASRPRCSAIVLRLVAMLVSAVLCGCATQPTEVTHKVVMTKVRADPAHPVRFDYPLNSKILREEGVCKVKLTVTADGTVRDMSLTVSTGYPRLDQACLEAFVHGGLLPATEDGKPITTTLEIPITWTLAAAPAK